GAPSGTVWLYVGTYTAGSNGNGIYLFQLDLFTGELTLLKVVAPPLPASGLNPSTASPSWLALDPTRTHLYAGNEYGPPGAVSAYSINRLTGDLTLLNGQPTVGAPVHVSVDQQGKFLFCAEYSGGYFEVFPIQANGSLGAAVFQQQDIGNIGAHFASNGPPGSFAFSAHEGPNGHPHQLETDLSNQWAIGTDTGQDRIYIWKLTQGITPPLTPAAIPFVTTPTGDGPRRFAFHPNGVWLYSIQEEASTIMFWSFNRATGALSSEQIIPSVPPGFAGTSFASEIRVSADGDFVYAANRLSDTVCVFKVGGDGRLTQKSQASTLGDYPRTFAIDPLGRFVVVANQRADNLTTFSVKPGNGTLKFVGNYTPVGSPAAIVYLS
ncbi:MAG TPA: lactonase family protein, partial [Pyrinomonadaceae bacterium]